mmetsp:Transcript_57794/g.67465  ORF Transcript_57794/g.67465 Transcript_57794/m.67465 type:complete len:112 (+) Transcript_57794:181-516(+)
MKAEMEDRIASFKNHQPPYCKKLLGMIGGHTVNSNATSRFANVGEERAGMLLDQLTQMVHLCKSLCYFVMAAPFSKNTNTCLLLSVLKRMWLRSFVCVCETMFEFDTFPAA